MSLAEIRAAWIKQAEDMERNAKSYNRSCVKAKAAQLILMAKAYRGCAEEIEAYEADQARQQGSDTGAAAAVPGTGEALAEGQP